MYIDRRLAEAIRVIKKQATRSALRRMFCCNLLKKGVTKTFSRKSDATDFGRKIARNQGSKLVIHNRNGQISHKDSHGNDPFPPKG